MKQITQKLLTGGVEGRDPPSSVAGELLRAAKFDIGFDHNRIMPLHQRVQALVKVNRGARFNALA